MIVGLAAAENAADFSIARELFDEYARELGVDLCFQNFTSELANLDTMYAALAGRLLLARGDGQIIGCVGVRRWSENACEMKRLYVRASARGLGVGRRLAKASIEAARELGYETMLLDTLTTMAAAQDLYRLEEIASELRWTESFSNSQDALAKLAEEALTEYAQGRTRPM